MARRCLVELLLVAPLLWHKDRLWAGCGWGCMAGAGPAGPCLKHAGVSLVVALLAAPEAVLVAVLPWWVAGLVEVGGKGEEAPAACLDVLLLGAAAPLGWVE